MSLWVGLLLSVQIVVTSTSCAQSETPPRYQVNTASGPVELDDFESLSEAVGFDLLVEPPRTLLGRPLQLVDGNLLEEPPSVRFVYRDGRASVVVSQRPGHALPLFAPGRGEASRLNIKGVDVYQRRRDESISVMWLACDSRFLLSAPSVARHDVIEAAEILIALCPDDLPGAAPLRGLAILARDSVLVHEEKGREQLIQDIEELFGIAPFEIVVPGHVPHGLTLERLVVDSLSSRGEAAVRMDFRSSDGSVRALLMQSNIKEDGDQIGRVLMFGETPVRLTLHPDCRGEERDCGEVTLRWRACALSFRLDVVSRGAEIAAVSPAMAMATSTIDYCDALPWIDPEE